MGGGDLCGALPGSADGGDLAGVLGGVANLVEVGRILDFEAFGLFSDDEFPVFVGGMFFVVAEFFVAAVVDRAGLFDDGGPEGLIGGAHEDGFHIGGVVGDFDIEGVGDLAFDEFNGEIAVGDDLVGLGLVVGHTGSVVGVFGRGAVYGGADLGRDGGFDSD